MMKLALVFYLIISFSQTLLAETEDSVHLELNGEFRYRLEYRDDFNFNDAAFEDDAVNLLRTRLGIRLQLCPYFQVYAQGQDSESFANQQSHKSAAFVNQLDLRQLYAEFRSPLESVPLSVKAGRQELSYGDERFVGAFGWSNVARVFDAAKVIFAPAEWFQADAWFSQVVEVNKSRADSGRHDDNFYGIYTALKPFKDHILDTFFFVRHNLNNEIAGEKPGELGQLKEYTIGNRFKGEQRLPGQQAGIFDYGIEWAVQFGSRAHDDIEAWAWHNELGYTFDVLPWDPRIHFEYNHGSGDSDPRDGTFENFDNLFPTNHVYYGYMDFAALRNMDNIKVGAGVTPHQKIKFSADYHWFFLDTNGSGWFNAGQSVIRPATAGASTTLGQELDLLANWGLTKHLNLLIGYSHFHAGAFVRDSGSADDANFFYGQMMLKI